MRLHDKAISDDTDGFLIHLPGLCVLSTRLDVSLYKVLIEAVTKGANRGVTFNIIKQIILEASL